MLHDQRVTSGRHAEEMILPSLVGDAGVAGHGGLIFGGDRGFRHGEARGVLDGTEEFRAAGLGEAALAGEEGRKE